MHELGRSIEIDGARIHTQTRGTPGGRALVFLHGGLGTLDDFDPLVGAFEDCHCVLVDSRGHGASTLGPEPLSYPRLAADVEAVIAAHGLDRPVIVGHSDGGITGVHLAFRGRAGLGGLNASTPSRTSTACSRPQWTCGATRSRATTRARRPPVSRPRR